MGMIVAAGSLSGCTSPAATGDNGTPTVKPGGTTTPAGSNSNATVSQSGDTITITGTKTDSLHAQFSQEFTLSQGAYIFTFSNKDGPGDNFVANIASPSGDYYQAISVKVNSGEGFMSVYPDNDFARPGPAVLCVDKGGTYTVTLTRPTSGADLPVTLNGQPQETKVKAVQLAAGAVTIDVMHNGFKSGEQGSTVVSLVNVRTGMSVPIGGAFINGETGHVTGTVEEAGLYLFGVTFRAHTTGEATLTQ